MAQENSRYTADVKEQLIKQGMWPDYENSIANLPNSVLKKFGVEPNGRTLPVMDRYLEKGYRNIVVLLLDGMGINIMERNLEPDGFFRSHLVTEYSSTFPPTTVAATTSIDSGLMPIEHAWLGWDCYYPQVDKNVTVFLNVEQGTETPAADFNVACTVCPYESVIAKMNRAGAKACYATPFAPPFPQTLSQVLDRVAELCAQDGPKYIYSYWNEPDSTMHRDGCYVETSRSVLREIEQTVREYADRLSDTLLIVTADHGHIDSRNMCLEDYPEMTDCLLRLPSIEPRALNLFVKPERKADFEEAFGRYLGSDFLLFTRGQVLESGLFGTGAPHENAEGMLGDYLAVPVTDLSIFNTREEKDKYKGVHAGLTKAELRIPFIAIEKD